LHHGEDKHAKKALNFIENMKFNDSCIGFSSKIKQCGCLAQFLGKEVTPSDTKILECPVISALCMMMMIYG